MVYFFNLVTHVTNNICLMREILIIFSIWFAFTANATHNRGGQITYKHLFGTTYEFTIKTCTESSSDANRSELVIYYGDGTADTVALTTRIEDPTYGVFINSYISIHEYTGPGIFSITMVDPNRNENVVNIPNSVAQPFCVLTTLIISPFTGNVNSSPQFESCPCPEFACIGSMYVYNPGAYDPDGDSLSYELTVPRTDTSCRVFLASEYYFPDDIPGNGTMTLDPVTGNLVWDDPQIAGDYNIAIHIQEWRNGVALGHVIHDFQLTVAPGNCNNQRPIIDPVPDFCVFSGDTVSFTVTASDDDTEISKNKITLNAYGTPVQYCSCCNI
jgi:hypothetical protein